MANDQWILILFYLNRFKLIDCFRPLSLLIVIKVIGYLTEFRSFIYVGRIVKSLLVIVFNAVDAFVIGLQLNP